MKSVCVCVCVFEREIERERPAGILLKGTQKQNIILTTPKSESDTEM